jgi:hypothetical protein
VTEFIGLLLIFLGFKLNVGDIAPGRVSFAAPVG